MYVILMWRDRIMEENGFDLLCHAFVMHSFLICDM